MWLLRLWGCGRRDFCTLKYSGGVRWGTLTWQRLNSKAHCSKDQLTGGPYLGEPWGERGWEGGLLISTVMGYDY